MCFNLNFSFKWLQVGFNKIALTMQQLKRSRYMNLVNLSFFRHQAVILARTRCDVSLTALRDESPDDIQTTALRMRTKRPLSAPGTRDEISTAEKLTSVVNKNTSPATSPRIPAQRSTPNKLRPHTSHHTNQYSPRTLSTNARSGIREKLVPTPVDISNQGIQNLRAQKEFLSWFCQAALNEKRVYLWVIY